MLYYEVKLINPETKEVYFREVSIRPKIPTKELLDKYLGAIIVINTTSNPNSTD